MRIFPNILVVVRCTSIAACCCGYGAIGVWRNGRSGAVFGNPWGVAGWRQASGRRPPATQLALAEQRHEGQRQHHHRCGWSFPFPYGDSSQPVDVDPAAGKAGAAINQPDDARRRTADLGRVQAQLPSRRRDRPVQRATGRIAHRAV